MTTNAEMDSTNLSLHQVSAPTQWKRSAFYGIAIVFNICLVAQVLTVGVAYFENPVWWTVHVWLVRGYSGLSLLLWAGTWFVRLPGKIRSLSMGLVVLLGLQFCSWTVRSFSFVLAS